MDEQGTYKCRWCKATFDEPDIASYTENLDGEQGIWTYHYWTCPICGSDEVFEIDDDDEGEDI